MTTKTIKARGTIRITNTDTGETKVSATYDAADIIKALHRGESIESIIARLEDVSRVHKPLKFPDHDPKNSFPFGM